MGGFIVVKFLLERGETHGIFDILNDCSGGIGTDP